MTETSKKDRRKQTVSIWQARWDALENKADWTKKLIPNIEKWLKTDRIGIKLLTYEATQFLTGYGCNWCKN